MYIYIGILCIYISTCMHACIHTMNSIYTYICTHSHIHFFKFIISFDFGSKFMNSFHCFQLEFHIYLLFSQSTTDQTLCCFPSWVAWTLVIVISLSHCLCTFWSGVPGRMRGMSMTQGEMQRKSWTVSDLESDCSTAAKVSIETLLQTESFQWFSKHSTIQFWFLIQETMPFIRRHDIDITLSSRKSKTC